MSEFPKPVGFKDGSRGEVFVGSSISNLDPLFTLHLASEVSQLLKEDPHTLSYSSRDIHWALEQGLALVCVSPENSDGSRSLISFAQLSYLGVRDGGEGARDHWDLQSGIAVPRGIGAGYVLLREAPPRARELAGDKPYILTTTVATSNSPALESIRRFGGVEVGRIERSMALGLAMVEFDITNAGGRR